MRHNTHACVTLHSALSRSWLNQGNAVAALLVAACAIGAAPRVAEALTLVKDGQATYTVVTGDNDAVRVASRENADVTYVYDTDIVADAAADLVEHIARVGQVRGTTKPASIVREPSQAPAGPRILLGNAAIKAHGLQHEADQLPYPAYIYRVVGNDLLIFGSSSKGTANGVYGFLQDELHVRWFGPQPHFQIAPEQSEIVLGPLDKRAVPSYLGREVTLFGVTECPVTQWGTRYMRLSERFSDNAPFTNASHNILKVFRPQTYLAEHPEYYAMRGNARQNPVAGSQLSRTFAVCWSNPEVADVATRSALNFFDRNPKANSFSLGINDGLAFCECKDCGKLQPRRDYRGQQVASDMYFHFVNEVARRVAQKYPDRYIGVIAYNDVTAPPLGRVEDNVFVLLVNDISEYYDRELKRRDQELVEAWEAKRVPLGLYYYTGLAKLTPAYFARHLADELKDKHARGFRAVFCEANPGWPWHGPMVYVQARLLWDVNLSIDALLEEYFSQLFGPAAKPMSELYALFEEIHIRPRDGGFLYEHYKYAQFRPYTAEDLDRMQALIDEAHALFDEVSVGQHGRDHPAARVAYVTNGLRVFLNMLEGKVTAERLRDLESEPMDTASAVQRLNMVQRLGMLVRDNPRVYRETIINDPTMPNRYTNDTVRPVRLQWRSDVSSVIAPTLAKLEGQTGHGANAQVKRMIKQTVEHQLDDPFKRALFMLESGRASLERNLLRNPDFETLDDKGEPVNWGHSPGLQERGGRFDTFAVSSRDAEVSGRVARLRTDDERVYLLTSGGPVEPGTPYLCTIRARLSSSDQARMESKAKVYMLIRWRSRSGWIRGRADYVSDPINTTNEWVKLQTLAVAPEDAMLISMWIWVENLQGGEEVHLDNATAQRVRYADDS